MSIRQRAMKMGIILLVLLVVAGLCLLFTGHDAVVQAMKIKSGILTANRSKFPLTPSAASCKKKQSRKPRKLRRAMYC